MDGQLTDKPNWKYPELSAQILGVALNVSNTLGAGFLEVVYHNAMVFALSKAGLSVETQRPFVVTYEDIIVGKFNADLVVEGKILVELKAVKVLIHEHSAQVLNYLRASELEVGLLLNFGVPRMEYKRLVMSAKPV